MQVLLHSRDDSALVDELGILTSTGSHSLISITRKQTISLPEPWGDYDPLAEPIHTCMDKCRAQYIATKCNCRAFYMEEETNVPGR